MQADVSSKILEVFGHPSRPGDARGVVDRFAAVDAPGLKVRIDEAHHPSPSQRVDRGLLSRFT